MFLAFDSHSDAALAGAMTAPFLMAAVALIVLWAATRSWRAPKAARVPEDLPVVRKLGRQRTRQVALWSVAILAVAAGMDVVTALRSGDQYGSAASKGSTTLTVTPPASFGGYQLVKGALADQVAAQAKAKLPGAMVVSLYAPAASPDRPALVILTDSSSTDPQVAQDLADHSADYGNLNFMAGAGIDNARVLPPGPAGGEMQCGETNGSVACSWVDSSTEGVLMSRSAAAITLQQLAAITRQFRAAAEH